MADLAFAGSGYTPPVGVADLQFGITEGPSNNNPGVVLGITPRPQALISGQFGYELFVSNQTIPPTATVNGGLSVSGNVIANTIQAQAVISGERDINVDRDPKAMFSGVWDDATKIRVRPASSWNQAQTVRPNIFNSWNDGEKVRTEITENFKQANRQNTTSENNWQAGAPVSKGYLSTADIPIRVNISVTDNYEVPDKVGAGVSLNTDNALSLNNNRRVIVWQQGGFVTRSWIDELQDGITKNFQHTIVWEQATNPPIGDFGGVAPPEPPEPPEPPKDFDADLIFCALPSNVFLTPLRFGFDYCSIVPTVPIRSVYIVTNSAQIVRVSDGTDIPASSVTLSIDIDSFAWDMSADIVGRDAVALIEGTDASPVEVDVIINGTTWRVLVDGWSLQEVAAGASASIRGRSRSAYLASPYSLPRDYLETNARNAQQLAAQELPVGWTLTWNALDWLVPANTWRYQNLTPIAAINKIAEAGGAFVITDTFNQELIVNPKYPATPWDWESQTPAFNLPRDILFQRSSQKTPGSGVNAVWVHGESGGVLAKVRRTGTAGNVLAPTVVDPLLSTSLAARERGIAAIAQKARQSVERYDMPLDAALGGLRTPGEIIAIGEGSPFVADFNGMVRAVNISATATRKNSGAALSVRQSLALQRYFADPV